MLDLGHATSRLLILRGDRLLQARTLHAGGLHLTRNLAREQKLGFLAARAKRWESMDEGGRGDSPADCRVAELLLEELRLSLRHHAARHPDGPVERLRICGGEAASDARVRGLGEALHLPVARFDPLAERGSIAAGPATSGFDPAAGTPGWAVPWGLCHSELNL